MNWRGNATVDAQENIPSHLKKITGVLDFLEWATSDDAINGTRLAEDDLILMLDAHDVWLQLPPSVLLQRYFAANDRANERLATQFGASYNAMTRQTILASSQKRCVAPRNKFSHLNCDYVPESPLPDTVFGLFTDSRLAKPQYWRPRWLNSGSFMGPAGDMKRYFRRVDERMYQHLTKVEKEDDLSGDQGIFAEIFGEQEVWRYETSMNETGERSFVRRAEAGEQFEYHVGLDYNQELFYPTCYSEHSGYFVSLDDTKSVAESSKHAGVEPPRVHGVPKDVNETRMPLAELEQSAAMPNSWASVPLYVDFWTTSIPVAIHHNAWKNGLKNRQRAWWDKTWYFPHLRQLLEFRMWSNSTLLPTGEMSAASGSLTLWPYPRGESSKAAMLFEQQGESGTRSLRSASWTGVCESSDERADTASRWYDEVFRDGKGPL